MIRRFVGRTAARIGAWLVSRRFFWLARLGTRRFVAGLRRLRAILGFGPLGFAALGVVIGPLLLGGRLVALFTGLLCGLRLVDLRLIGGLLAALFRLLLIAAVENLLNGVAGLRIGVDGTLVLAAAALVWLAGTARPFFAGLAYALLSFTRFALGKA